MYSWNLKFSGHIRIAQTIIYVCFFNLRGCTFKIDYFSPKYNYEFFLIETDFTVILLNFDVRSCSLIDLRENIAPELVL